MDRRAAIAREPATFVSVPWGELTWSTRQVKRSHRGGASGRGATRAGSGRVVGRTALDPSSSSSGSAVLAFAQPTLDYPVEEHRPVRHSRHHRCSGVALVLVVLFLPPATCWVVEAGLGTPIPRLRPWIHAAIAALLLAVLAEEAVKQQTALGPTALLIAGGRWGRGRSVRSALRCRSPGPAPSRHRGATRVRSVVPHRITGERRRLRKPATRRPRSASRGQPRRDGDPRRAPRDVAPRRRRPCRWPALPELRGVGRRRHVVPEHDDRRGLHDPQRVPRS